MHEVLGTHAGFDVRAEDTAGVYEVGATVPRGAQLIVDVPKVAGLDPNLPAPVIRTRALWIEPGGNVTEVASSTMDKVTVALGAPGAYRIEISIIPRHLGPYLGDLGTDMADVEMPWIYFSPFYVQ